MFYPFLVPAERSTTVGHLAILSLLMAVFYPFLSQSVSQTLSVSLTKVKWESLHRNSNCQWHGVRQIDFEKFGEWAGAGGSGGVSVCACVWRRRRDGRGREGSRYSCRCPQGQTVQLHGKRELARPILYILKQCPKLVSGTPICANIKWHASPGSDHHHHQ